ncbi:hypothetical protein QMK19_38385 [Streptomyces sp. H10-C2]|nr:MULTISPECIES: hypothetical protein [unclassified Streptomyces]MDJ0347046.1 hypothetical protein [Streptomyces sp. PH10-H1]MDJ0375314.1 hypothetical protein [Streptomyces sp. H10-C2]
MEELLDRERELRAVIGAHPAWATAVLEEAPAPRARPALCSGALEQAA